MGTPRRVTRPTRTPQTSSVSATPGSNRSSLSLGNVVIADDLDAALALRATHPSSRWQRWLVEFISDHGILSAVSTSYIAEINSLSEEAVTLEARTSDLAAAKAESEQKEGAARPGSNAVARRSSCPGSHARRQGRRTERAGDRATRSGNQIHTVDFRAERDQPAEHEETRQRQEILEALSATEAGEAQLREQILAAHQAVSELTARREEATNELTSFAWRSAASNTSARRFRPARTDCGTGPRFARTDADLRRRDCQLLRQD